MTKVKTETIGIPELSAALAESQDITKAKAKLLVDALRDQIVQSLLASKRVNLFGLGTFEVRTTKAKVGRNPKTGQRIDIPEGRKATFKAAKGLKEQL